MQVRRSRSSVVEMQRRLLGARLAVRLPVVLPSDLTQPHFDGNATSGL
jgi:hypothetical protein